MTRPSSVEFPKSVKLAAWQRCGGKCECCGQKIITGVEYDHIVEVAIGGDNSLENCRVMSAKCHKAKTSSRRPEIDKVRRGFEKRINARPKRSRLSKPKGMKFDWQQGRYVRVLTEEQT